MSTWFILISTLILLFVALAKLLSSFSQAKVQSLPDPILGLPFRPLLRLVASVEISVAILAMTSRTRLLGAAYVAWLATLLTVYRICLWAINWHQPCSCLGNLTEMIGIPAGNADFLMKGLLAFLLIGSYLAMGLEIARSGKFKKSTHAT